MAPLDRDPGRLDRSGAGGRHAAKFQPAGVEIVADEPAAIVGRQLGGVVGADNLDVRRLWRHKLADDPQPIATIGRLDVEFDAKAGRFEGQQSRRRAADTTPDQRLVEAVLEQFGEVGVDPTPVITCPACRHETLGYRVAPARLVGERVEELVVTEAPRWFVAAHR